MAFASLLLRLYSEDQVPVVSVSEVVCTAFRGITGLVQTSVDTEMSEVRARDRIRSLVLCTKHYFSEFARTNLRELPL
jgi:hypothetical protein